MSDGRRAKILGVWGLFFAVADRDLLISVTGRCLSLWLRWVAANLIGGTLSLILWRILTPMGGSVLGSIVGFLPLSIAQSLVLRRHLPPGPWVVAVAAGLTIGYHAWYLIDSRIGITAAIAAMGPSQGLEVLGVLVDTQPFWQWTLSLLAIWGAVGVAQWLVLRRHIQQTGAWVLGSALGGAVSGIAGLVVMSAGDDLLLSWLARWGVYGALTGLVLVWLLHERLKRHSRRRHAI